MDPKKTHPVTPCRRCGCGTFIWIPTVLDRAGGEHEEAKPFALTYLGGEQRLFGLIPMGIGTEHPLGHLEAYICRGCGLTELFTKGHALIPIGEEYGTYAVDVPEVPPYP